jgi:hypothetical protein
MSTRGGGEEESGGGEGKGRKTSMRGGEGKDGT